MSRSEPPPPADPWATVAVPPGDTLDLHTFRPSEVGSLVPEWLATCRATGSLHVRVVHGKGTGALRAGVIALLERSPLVQTLHTDGNWGGVAVDLWDPAADVTRVRSILEGCPRFNQLLDAVAAVGPPGAWIGAGAVRNRVWHALHRREGEPEDPDVDVVWHGRGDAAEDARWTTALAARLTAPWEVVDQARMGAASAEAGIASWPETATAIAARRDRGGIELLAAHGWADVVGMVVCPRPGIPPEVYQARLATKRWRARFPWAQVIR